MALAKLPQPAAVLPPTATSPLSHCFRSPPRSKVYSSTKKPSPEPPVLSVGLSTKSFRLPSPLLQFKRSPRTPRASSEPSRPFNESTGASAENGSLPRPEKSLLRRAGLIGVATVASKILGLVREIVLASVVGVGPVATAFNHAVVLPRFSTSFLGGVNGPIHVTVAATLSKLSRENRRQLTQKTHTLLLLLGGALAALTYIFAEHIIFVSAPGLWVMPEGQLVREMATNQLRLMTPCILVAGSVGIGFGCLTAEGDDIFASLSPSLTSTATIISCLMYALLKEPRSHSMTIALAGVFISCGASMGSLLQWIMQAVICEKSGYSLNSISWKDYFKDKNVHKLFALMLPAILSSGLVQISSLTDLYFSSFIPGAAAGLSYAHLVAVAPLGILSSSVVLPMLRILSRLTKPSSQASLKENLQKAILLCMAIVLPITCTMCVLAGPIISVLFQRFVFDSNACSFVSSLLLCYSIGSPFWIVRELLASIFYTLGDGSLPFLINVSAIGLNGILDWLSTSVFGLGAQGLALSTSCVAALSVIALLLLLSKKLRGTINLSELVGPLLLLVAYSIISGLTTKLSYGMLKHLLSFLSILRFCRLAEGLSILLAGSLGIAAFYLPLLGIQFAGVNIVDNL